MKRSIDISEQDFDEFDFINSTCNLPTLENNTVIIYVKNFHYGDIEVEEGVFEFRNVNYIEYHCDDIDKKVGKRRLLVSKNVSLYPFGSNLKNGDYIEVLIECNSCFFTQL
jgi:hypothetical protein